VAKKTLKQPRLRPGKATEGARGDLTEVQPAAGDVALVLGKDADGLHILRRRTEEGPIEAGLLRPMQQGKPIVGEVVTLTPRQDLPMVFDVKTEFSTSMGRASADPAADEASGDRPALDGPAQVASDAYRKGWDAVWGSRRRERSIN